MIHEDGAAGDQTKRWFYRDKAMGGGGILDVFVAILVFCFICLFVIGILYIVTACIQNKFSIVKIKNQFLHISKH